MEPEETWQKCQELPEKSVVQASDCFRGCEEKRIWLTYKDMEHNSVGE